MAERRIEDIIIEKGSIVSKILWVMMVVLYFCPLFTIEYLASGNYSLTGINVTFGLTKMGQHVHQGSHMFASLAVIPIIVLAVNFLCNKFHDITKYNLVGAIAQLFILVTYLIGFSKMYESNYVSIGFYATFYMEILLTVVLIILSIYLMPNTQVISETDEDLSKKGIRFIILYCLSVVVIVLIVANLSETGNLL